MSISTFETDAGVIRDNLMECCNDENVQNAVIALSDIVAGIQAEARRKNKVAEQLSPTAPNEQIVTAFKELTVWSEAWWGMGSSEAWQSFRGIHERLNSALKAVTKAKA